VQIDGPVNPVWPHFCPAPRTDQDHAEGPAGLVAQRCDADRQRYVDCCHIPRETCNDPNAPSVHRSGDNQALAAHHDPTQRAAYANDPVGKPNPVRETTLHVDVVARYETTRISWKGGLIDLLM
jgi:hypothetical protein